MRMGLLGLSAARPTSSGLEMHLAAVHKQVRDFQPALVVADPVSSLTAAGTEHDAGQMLVRLIDFLKAGQVTAVLTNLTSAGDRPERTEVGISSIIDTWIMLRDIELGGERNRALYVLKSRGMAHSNQIREYRLTDRGIELLDVYVGPEGVLTGTMRLAQEARERETAQVRQQEIERRKRELERKRLTLEGQVAALRARFEAEQDELQRLIAQQLAGEERVRLDRQEMARRRMADAAESPNSHARKDGSRGGNR
jgi:circadian clock protein KaiC